MRQFDAAFGGVIHTTLFMFPLAVVVAVVAVLVRCRWLRVQHAIRISVVDVALVYSTLFVVHLVVIPQPVVVENAVRLVPGTDLGVAVHAEPGDIAPWLQLLGNLLLLLPLGALLPLRLAAVDSCAKAALVVLATTCCIELVQYAVLTGRVVSADDVLLNTAGGLAGALLSRRWWADFRVPQPRPEAARARAAALRPQYARPHGG